MCGHTGILTCYEETTWAQNDEVSQSMINNTIMAERGDQDQSSMAISTNILSPFDLFTDESMTPQK